MATQIRAMAPRRQHRVFRTAVWSARVLGWALMMIAVLGIVQVESYRTRVANRRRRVVVSETRYLDGPHQQGHDRYDKVREDVEFRKEVAKSVESVSSFQELSIVPIFQNAPKRSRS